jgi:hypothetical protein
MTTNLVVLLIAIAWLILMLAIVGAAWLYRHKAEKLIRQFEQRLDARFAAFEQ